MLKSKHKFDTRNIKNYKLEAICVSKIYIKEVAWQLLRLSYLVSCKNYAKEENI